MHKRPPFQPDHTHESRRAASQQHPEGGSDRGSKVQVCTSERCRRFGMEGQSLRNTIEQCKRKGLMSLGLPSHVWWTHVRDHRGGS